MRSSEAALRPLTLVAVCAGVWLAGCNTANTAPAAPRASLLRSAACPLSQNPRAAELQRSVEAEPLYAAVSASGLVSCRVAEEEGEAYTLTYSFRDGSQLLAKRDARIEYSERELRLASAPAEDPLVILARAEQAVFGAAGCGIDWQASAEVQPARGEAGAVDSVYRGATCNCQARVRRDGAGRITGLVLRSSC